MRVPTLVVLSGVPRSGKTTLARFLHEQHGFRHVSADQVRDEYGMKFGAEDPREALVNHAVQYRALEGLMMQQDVVIDSTAMFFKQRQLYFELARYALGRLYPVPARRLLVSLAVDESVWEQRLRDAGRTPQYKSFYFGRFHPVGDDEAAALDGHLQFANNSTDDLETIKAVLSDWLRAPTDDRR